MFPWWCRAERRTYDHRAARFVVEPNPAAPGNRGGGRGLSRPDGPDRSGVSIRWHAFTGDRHATRKERSGDANPDSPPHNAGAKEAASEYIAFTDAGIRLDPYWLESLCAAFNPAPGAIAPRPDIVFGSYEPVLSKFFHRCAATAYVPARSGKPGQEIRGPVIASCLMRRSIVGAAGGFPPYRASEDLIFLETIQQRRWSIAYAPATVAHRGDGRGSPASGKVPTP
jgi:hypothetical protein